MSIILKSVSATRNLLKFTQYANLFYSKRDSSSLLRKKILPVNAAIRSPYSSVCSELSEIDEYEKPPPYRPKQKESRYFKERDIKFLVNKVKNINPLTYNQSCTLLKSCSQISYTEPPEVRRKMTNLVWETLKQSGTQMDIFHYNILLALYIDYEHKFSYEEFLCELESKGIQPNEVTYQRLLKACCQQGNITEATALLKKIQGGDMPIDEFIFNTIIYGYCQANDINGALGVISLMERKNMKPSSATYCNLLCVYARDGNLEEMKNILSKCEELNIKIDDTQFWEVIYNLIVSGHEKHVDFIYKKMDKSYLFIKGGLKTMYRIFFQNMDKAALLVYNMIFRENDQTNNEKEFFRNFFLDNIRKNKTPEEILKTCQSLFSPEDFNTAISGILKKMLGEENLEKVAEFLLELQKTDFPIRPHYFWPLIIKASKHGNDEICKVLKVMNELEIKPCFETIDLVLQHFNFENSLNYDIALLAKYRIFNQRILHLLLFNLLKKNQFEKAVQLSLLKKFEVSASGLVSMLNEKSAKYIAHIFYNLLHDVYLNSSNFVSLPNDDLIEKIELPKNSLDECHKNLNSFVRLVVKKKEVNVVLAFLQELHNYPVKISQETASLIKEKFPGNRKIENVCEELTSTTAEEDLIKLDKAVLKSKKSLTLFGIGPHKTLYHKKLPVAKKQFEALGDAITVADVITMMTLYLRNRNVEEALNLLEKLKTAKKTTLPQNQLEVYCSFIYRELLSIGDEKALNKVTNVFEELGLQNEKLCCLAYIKNLINRGELHKAVDFYCGNIKKLRTKGYGLIVDSLIETKNTELLGKVINSLVSEVGADALTLIFFKYVSKGYTKDAKKFFDFNNVIINYKHLNFFCEMFLREQNERGLLCLLEFAEDFNVKKVLWSLLNLYVKKKEPEKIKKLNLIIQEKTILAGSEFHRTINQILVNIDQELPITHSLVGKFMRISQEDEKDTEDTIGFDDLVDLIEKGQFEEIISNYYPKNRFEIRRACSKLLNNNKSETYVKFLEKAFETKSYLFEYLIMVQKIFNNLTKDQVSKVLDMATRGLEKGNYQPIKNILTECLNQPQLLETFDKEIDKVFSCESGTKVILRTSVIQDFLDNKNLSQETRALGYSVIIYTSINYNLENSVTYLEEAVKEGIGHLLNKKVLSQLRDKMKKEEMNFPYLDLLN